MRRRAADVVDLAQHRIAQILGEVFAGLAIGSVIELVTEDQHLCAYEVGELARSDFEFHVLW